MSFNWGYCTASCNASAEHRAASVGALGKKDLLYAANTTSSGSEGMHEPECVCVCVCSLGQGVHVTERILALELRGKNIS